MRVVAAWAEHCSGPGWANSILWYLTNTGGEYKVECIQPGEQTAEMYALFNVSAEVNGSMVRAVESKLRKKGVKLT